MNNEGYSSFEDYLRHITCAITDYSSWCKYCAIDIFHIFDKTDKESRVFLIPKKPTLKSITKNSFHYYDVEYTFTTLSIITFDNSEIGDRYSRSKGIMSSSLAKNSIYSNNNVKCDVVIKKEYGEDYSRVITTMIKQIWDPYVLQSGQCYLIFEIFTPQINDMSFSPAYISSNFPIMLNYTQKIKALVTPDDFPIERKKKIIETYKDILKYASFNLVVDANFAEHSKKSILDGLEDYYNKYIAVSPFENDPMFASEDVQVQENIKKLLK